MVETVKISNAWTLIEYETLDGAEYMNVPTSRVIEALVHLHGIGTVVSELNRRPA